MSNIQQRKPKNKAEAKKQYIITQLTPITEDDIKKGFDAHEFISSISERLLPNAVKVIEDGRYELFDPEPLHIAFEHTLNDLQRIRDKVDKGITKRARDFKASERDYKSKLKEINKTFEEISESFKALDSRIGVISKKVVRVGQNLESVETERVNALHAKCLIELIMKLNSKSDSEEASQNLMSSTMSTDYLVAMNSAITVKNLLIIGQELDIDQTEKAKQAIKQLGIDVENHLINQFVKAVKGSRYTVMSETASILFIFNGGTSCIEAYIGTLGFLKDENAQVDHQDSAVNETTFVPKLEIWEEKSEVEEDESTTKESEEEVPEVEELDLASLGIVELEELPVPEDLPGAMDSKQNPPAPNSTPAEEPIPDFKTNQKNLDNFFKYLVKNINHEDEVIKKVFKPPYEVYEVLIKTIYSKTIKNKLQKMLTDRRDLDCFLRTLEFAMEKSRDLAEKLLVMYPTYNAHVIINEFVFKELIQDYCSTEVTSMVQFLNGLIDEELDKKRRKLEILKAKQEAESTLLSGFAGRLLGQEETSIELELDPEIPLKFIVRAQEAIHRATLLSGDDLFAGRQSSNLKTIFKTVIREFGQKYMLKCVDRVVQKITVDEPRTEPQTEIFFNMIALTNSNMILIQKIFFENIKPHFATENARNDLTLCIKEKQQLTTELEDLVIQGLTKCLNTMVTWVRKLLSRDQGRNDFRPAEDEISIGESTKACNSVCSFIQKQHNLITTSLDGKNLTLFLSEFGRRLLETILNHIRNFTISYGTGGLALMTDFRKYRETIGKFSIPGLDHELDMLYHIEKIYMVKAEELKGIIEESPLKNMKPSELDSYISKRSDYRSAWVGKFY